MIETRNGNKITYSIKKSDDEFEQKDLTTSNRKSIGYSDISKEEWDRIFKGVKNDGNKV